MSDVLKVPSTKAKARFGELEGHAEKRDVAVMDHARRKFMVIAPRRYDELLAIARVGKDRLRRLDEQFDALVAGMQTEAHAAAVERIAVLPLDDILAQGALQLAPARTPRVRARSRRAARR